MTTPILGSGTSINIPDSETEHRDVQGRRWHYIAPWNRDQTLTEAQKNFLKRITLTGLLGATFSVGMMVFGIFYHELFYPFCNLGLSGGIVSLAVMCFGGSLQPVFRDFNQRTNITAPIESSPVLAQV